MAEGATRSILEQPYPWGWFVVARSTELVAGAPLEMRYFGIDWRAERIDGAVRVRSLEDDRPLPVDEHSGLVMVWFHPRGEPTSFRVPAVPEHGAPGWLDWRLETLEIATHSREIVENVVDLAHFAPVHATEPHRFENVFEDHCAIQISEGIGAPNNKYKGSPYDLVATYHGPAIQFTTFRSRGMEARLVNAHTMIDPRRLHLRFGVLLRDPGDPAMGERFQRAYVADLQRGFEEDIAIWTHKIFSEEPLLCDGDGPIMKLRRWYAQFYR